MAERLTSKDAGGDLGNVSQASILNFIQELKAAESEVGSAMEACREARKGPKAIYKRIKDAGIRRDAFDRAYADNERVAEDREEEDRHYRYLMAMLGKPVQEDESPQAGDGTDMETDEHRALRMEKVCGDGFSAGRSGFDASINPWPNASDEWATWLTNWSLGQAAKVEDEIKPPQDTRRGRPRNGEHAAP